MAARQDQIALERELFSRVPRNMFEEWIARERAQLHRELEDSTDQVILLRAQGAMRMLKKLSALVTAANV